MNTEINTVATATTNKTMFYHLRPDLTYEKATGISFKNLPKKIRRAFLVGTLAGIYFQEHNVLVIGFSECSVNDNFRKSIGRNISENRVKHLINMYNTTSENEKTTVMNDLMTLSKQKVDVVEIPVGTEPREVYKTFLQHSASIDNIVNAQLISEKSVSIMKSFINSKEAETDQQPVVAESVAQTE